MKILIRNSDGIVIHADDTMVLTDTEVSGNGWMDRNFTASNATIAVSDLPEHWTGAAWSYINGDWSIVDQVLHDHAVAADAVATEAARLASIPQAVTMRQARLALLGAGLYTNVNAAVAAMPGATGDAARIEWEFSSTVGRHRPLVTALGTALGLSDAQLDALFIAAGAL